MKVLFLPIFQSIYEDPLHLEPVSEWETALSPGLLFPSSFPTDLRLWSSELGQERTAGGLMKVRPLCWLLRGHRRVPGGSWGAIPTAFCGVLMLPWVSAADNLLTVVSLKKCWVSDPLWPAPWTPPAVWPVGPRRALSASLPTPVGGWKWRCIYATWKSASSTNQPPDFGKTPSSCRWGGSGCRPCCVGSRGLGSPRDAGC